MKFAYTNIPAGQIMGAINQSNLNRNNTVPNAQNQGVEKYCQQCGAKVEGNFCPKCGSPISNTSQNIANQTPLPNNQNNFVGICCPRCRNTDLQIISDVKGKGVSATNLCLCGLLGLAGAGKTKTTHYWVCTKCGNKFKA